MNPAVRWYDGVRETLASSTNDYPYAATVYRVVEREHFVTSFVPQLVEIMPDFFVEVPEGLADDVLEELDGDAVHLERDLGGARIRVSALNLVSGK